MRFNVLLAPLVLVFGFCSSVSAQSLASLPVQPVSEQFKAVDLERSAQGAEWTLYADSENHLFYIDFEKFTFNLNEVVVKNEKDEVLFREDVFEMPVNTIYELDFSQYRSGSYFIELRSFTDVLRKKVTVD